MTRLSDENLKQIEMLIGIGLFDSRSKAVAYLTNEGIIAKKEMFDQLKGQIKAKTVEDFIIDRIGPVIKPEIEEILGHPKGDIRIETIEASKLMKAQHIIENNIKTYNYILRGTSKKYYIENSVGSKIITFFKKNNKVLVNFHNLTEYERQFLLSDDCLEDVLRNTEVIMIDQEMFDGKKDVLEKWSGNVIIHNGNALL